MSRSDCHPVPFAPRRRRALGALLLLALTTACPARPLVRLASTDWPPYSGASLPGQGETVALARRVFARAGYDLELTFLPWRQAQDAGMHGAGFSGYFPAYRSAARAESCLFSGELGASPVGLAVRASHPVLGSDAQSLSGLTLGVVAGYANTEEIDRRIQRRQQPVRALASDFDTLRALLAGHVDAVVIDRNVMTYLLNNTPSLRGQRGRLRFGETPLEIKTLHICFRHDDIGRDLKDAFDAALERF